MLCMLRNTLPEYMLSERGGSGERVTVEWQRSGCAFSTTGINEEVGEVSIILESTPYVFYCSCLTKSSSHMSHSIT
jgi:hypothetical protein